MSDIGSIAASIAFFALAWAYTKACLKLDKQEKP